MSLTQSENKTTGEDRAVIAILLLVFGAPLLGIFNIMHGFFAIVLLLAIVGFFVWAFLTN